MNSFLLLFSCPPDTSETRLAAFERMTAPPTIEARPVPAPRAGWFVGPRADAWFVLGGGVLVSLGFVVTAELNAGFLVASTLFAILSDFPHVLQTSVRVWLDPQERRIYGRHHLSSLVVVGVLVTTLMYTGQLVLLLGAWTYWQVFHVLKQHHGMVAIYAAKNGYKDSRREAKWALIACCLAPVVYRAAHGMQFGSYEVFGTRLPFSDLTVPTPPIPAALVVAAYSLAAWLLVRFAVQQRAVARAGRPALPPIALATVAVAIVSYNLSYLLVDDLYAVILIAAAVHSLQYHLISWARNNGRFEALVAEKKAESALLLARISLRRNVVAYALVFFLLGALLSTAETFLLGVVPLTFVFHHFYLDGVVWKPKRNPALVADLAMKPQGAAA